MPTDGNTLLEFSEEEMRRAFADLSIGMTDNINNGVYGSRYGFTATTDGQYRMTSGVLTQEMVEEAAVNAINRDGTFNYRQGSTAINNNIVPEYRAPNIIPYKPTVSADPILAARLTEIENKLNRILEYLEA